MEKINICPFERHTVIEGEGSKPLIKRPCNWLDGATRKPLAKATLRDPCNKVLQIKPSVF